MNTRYLCYSAKNVYLWEQIKKPMAAQEILKQSLHDVFVTALMKVQTLNMMLSDMYVQIIEESDNLYIVIYDDNDSEILKSALASVEDWQKGMLDNNTNMTELLTDVVFGTDLIDLFNEIDYNGPFSLLYVDNNMEVLSEILTIDKDNIVIGDEFWEKMDKELDEFFENLMSDIRYKKSTDL